MKIKRFWMALYVSILALAIAGFYNRPVQAHGVTPIHAQPEPGQSLAQSPGEVVLVFGEELVEQGNQLEVIDARGAVVDLDGGLDLNDPQHATLRARLPHLSEGIYTVRWTVKLLDEDTSSGEYQFGVGRGARPADQIHLIAVTGESAADNPPVEVAPVDQRLFILIPGGMLVFVIALALVIRHRKS